MKNFKKKFILTKKTADMLAFELNNPELVSGGKPQPIRVYVTGAGGGGEKICRFGYVWSVAFGKCVPAIKRKAGGVNFPSKR